MSSEGFSPVGIPGTPWGDAERADWRSRQRRRRSHGEDVVAAVEDLRAVWDVIRYGSPVVAHGVINYACRAPGLCAGMTGAPYVTTTEVYPDSASATPEQCNAAQVAAVRAAIGYVLDHPA